MNRTERARTQERELDALYAQDHVIDCGGCGKPYLKVPHGEWIELARARRRSGFLCNRCRPSLIAIMPGSAYSNCR